MKKSICVAALVGFMALGNAQISLGNVLNTGTKIAKAVTISDTDVVNYTKEYIKFMDTNNPVASAKDSYTKRLEKVVKNLKSYDGLQLNYKVYKVADINAFACADGSVRVFQGLMDKVNDEELLGIIGHEIGHVKNKDAKDAMKTALLSSALKEGIASAGGTAATLTNSQLGDLSEAVAKASFSKKQESAADDYGFELLKKEGKNPRALASVFQMFADMEAGKELSLKDRLFSSHPDSKNRIKNITKKADSENVPAYVKSAPAVKATSTKKKK